jgi:hypothetical protein
MGYSFPKALFLAAPGALNCIKSVCGYEPEQYTVSTISEATEVIEAVGDSEKYDTVVIDDFSFMAEQTFADLEARKFSGFRLWGKLRDETLAFRNKSRYCGVNVILNCWEQGSKTRDSGQFVKGGPMLSGRLPEQIPALCDIVLRAVPEERREPWPAAYRCFLSPQWVMKDRVEKMVSGSEPVFCGIPAEDRKHADAVYKALLDSGQSVHRARWTVRDALDRALIRRELAQADQTFFSSVSSVSSLR